MRLFLAIPLEKNVPDKLVELQKKSGFTLRVLEVVRKIPRGKVLTYAQVAKLAGRSKAMRAVGNILNKNYDPTIPCHRVVRSDGKLGGYNRGTQKKQQLLKAEGIKSDLPQSWH